MSEESGTFFIAFAGGEDAGLGESVVAEGVGLELNAHASKEGADGLAVGDDIGHASLERDDDHIIHEVDRLLAGDTFIGCFEGGIGLGDVGPLGLALEAFFDLADAGEIFVDFFAVAFAERALHPSPIDADEIEDRLLFLEAGVELGAGVAGAGEELVEEIEGAVDAGDRVSGLIPREGEAVPVAGVGATIRFFGRKDEGGITGFFSEMLGSDLVAGDGVVKALAGSAGDVGPGEVGSGATVGIRSAEVSEVGHHGDVVFMASERGEAFGHADFGKSTGISWVKSVLGETESPTEEDHALRRRRGSSLSGGERFKKGKRENRATESKEGSAGRRIRRKRH